MGGDHFPKVKLLECPKAMGNRRNRTNRRWVVGGFGRVHRLKTFVGFCGKLSEYIDIRIISLA